VLSESLRQIADYFANDRPFLSSNIQIFAQQEKRLESQKLQASGLLRDRLLGRLETFLRDMQQARVGSPLSLVLVCIPGPYTLKHFCVVSLYPKTS
jgi:hypothetical protein